MKKKYMSIVCFLLLFLSACTKKPEQNVSEYQLFFINKEETKVVSEGFSPNATGKKETVEAFIGALTTSPDDSNYKLALPEEVKIRGYAFGEAGQLILNFTSSYYTSLTGIREILSRAAIVKTFCQIDEIEYVEFNVNNQPLILTGDKPISMMKASDFIENTLAKNAYVTIYFSNETGDKLIESRREVDYDGVLSYEQLIMEQLIAGPVEDEFGMIPTLNSEIKVNSLTTKDGICYVDLNDEFLNRVDGVSEEVTIFSIVNSLVEQSNINKVQFLVNNEKVKFLQAIELDGFFERNLDIIEGEK